MRETYTPSSIIAIFNNAFIVDEEKKVIFIQGEYSKYGSKSYNGFYYDKIIDPSMQALSIKIPITLRDKLEDKKGYTFKGHLARKAKIDGNIALTFVASVTELPKELNLELNEKKREFEILRRKSNLKYKEIKTIINEKFRNNEKPHIAMIYGQESIVPADVMNAVDNAQSRFMIDEHRINFSDSGEIINIMEKVFVESSDIVAFVRGGGSGLEIFDNPEIAEAALNLKPALVTAIGHAESLTLLDMVADMKYDTPTAFGNALKEIALATLTSKTKKRKYLWVYILNIIIGILIGFLISRFW